ncbi:MAG: PAS domain-containing sensor histidine kinase, partial [Cyclobacteriaceae bacterium]|nr:PAS domain-containing sensor histidine kinase [Cyclobacteriaceae bacterium]
ESHLKNDLRYAVELRLRTKSGEYQWFSDSGQAVWNESGKPVRMVGSIIKIHERKVAEERIKKQNRMLEKTNLELDNFVYSASHDIRSPLTSILGLINIASKTNDKDELDECFHLMKSRVHRLDEFIEDILDFSRNIRVDKKLKEINLYYFIEEILNNHDFGDYFERLDVRLSLTSDFEVISDPLRLKIIIKNLLSNSSKFSNLRDESPWSRISALRVDGNFQLIIEDNGEGIREEFQDKIFDMFYRASEKSKGSGLGLYIVKEMVETLNGTIKLNSVYGEGSQFIIELPDHNYSQKTGDVATQEINNP